MADSLQSPEVWKMIYLARRNPALAPADFPQAWREHSALGRQCKNVGQRVLAVAQCARLLDAHGPQLATDYDGVNLMRLSDREAGAAIWSDPETLAIMRPDEPRVFADYVRNFSLLCRQQLLRSRLPEGAWPSRGSVILVGFLRRSVHWQGAAPSPTSCPSLWQQGALAWATQLVCNTVAEAPPAGYGYRYIVEWWFDTREDAERAAKELVAETPAFAADASDTAYGWGDSVFLLTEVTHSRP